MAIIQAFVFDYLVFTETIVELPKLLDVSDILVFTEEIDLVHTGVGPVQDTLVFVETITCSLKTKSIQQNLNFVETIRYGFTHHLTVSDRLSFYEQFRKGPALQIVHQELFWREYVQIPLAQELVFAETIDVFFGRYLNDILIFQETIKLNQHKVLHVSDTLTFIEGISGYVINTCRTPGIPPVVPQSHILLFGDTLHQITLRVPTFGNTDKVQDTRISRTSRGNDLVVYRDPRWPKTENFSYKVQMLSQQKVDQLLQFIEDSLGLSFALTDWLGFSWNVILTNPQTPVSQRGRSVWEAQLDFEVVET